MKRLVLALPVLTLLAACGDVVTAPPTPEVSVQVASLSVNGSNTIGILPGDAFTIVVTTRYVGRATPVAGDTTATSVLDQKVAGELVRRVWNTNVRMDDATGLPYIEVYEVYVGRALNIGRTQAMIWSPRDGRAKATLDVVVTDHLSP